MYYIVVVSVVGAHKCVVGKCSTPTIESSDGSFNLLFCSTLLSVAGETKCYCEKGALIIRNNLMMMWLVYRRTNNSHFFVSSVQNENFEMISFLYEIDMRSFHGCKIASKMRDIYNNICIRWAPDNWPGFGAYATMSILLLFWCDASRCCGGGDDDDHDDAIGQSIGHATHECMAGQHFMGLTISNKFYTRNKMIITFMNPSS